MLEFETGNEDGLLVRFGGIIVDVLIPDEAIGVERSCETT